MTVLALVLGSIFFPGRESSVPAERFDWTGYLLLVIANWGPCPDPPDPCPEDVDGNGDVGFTDLLIVIARWGPGGVQCLTEP